jgi:hypothetical protein
MLKLTSIALGLVSLISIAPSAQAAPVYNFHNTSSSPHIQKTVTIANRQPQISVTVNPQVRPGYHPEYRPQYRPQAFSNFRPKYRWESEYDYRRAVARHRQIEIAKERQARARWSAAHRYPVYPSPYQTYRR